MIKNRTLFILLIAALLTVSCDQYYSKSEQDTDSTVETDPAVVAQVRQIIEENNSKFGEAFRNGDAKAVADLYTEDTILLPPNSEVLRGRKAIEEFWTGGFQNGIKDCILTTLDITVYGDVAHEIGTYVLKVQPPGVDMIEDRGKYVVIWKKTSENVWKLHVDMFNTSLPAK